MLERKSNWQGVFFCAFVLIGCGKSAPTAPELTVEITASGYRSVVDVRIDGRPADPWKLEDHSTSVTVNASLAPGEHTYSAKINGKATTKKFTLAIDPTIGSERYILIQGDPPRLSNI